MKDTPQSQGFMLYADDWAGLTEDYSFAEIGEMLVALLNYFTTGEAATFPDRGMRQFFRQATKAIDRDRERYAKRCLQNSYNRYKGISKENGIEPLDYETWLTTVYNSQEPSTVVNDQTTKADETDQLQQQQQHTTTIATYNSNRNEEPAFDNITEALESGKITVDEAVALRLQRR